MLLAKNGLRSFEQLQGLSAIFLVECHAAISLGFEIAKIFRVGLFSDCLKSRVGPGRIALANIGGRRLQGPEDGLGLGAFQDSNGIFHTRLGFFPHQSIGVP